MSKRPVKSAPRATKAKPSPARKAPKPAARPAARKPSPARKARVVRKAQPAPRLAATPAPKPFAKPAPKPTAPSAPGREMTRSEFYRKWARSK